MSYVTDERTADILDLIQESVFERDLQGRVLTWNKASEQLYGYPKSKAIGQLADELLQTEYHGTSAEAAQVRLREKAAWDGSVQRQSSSGNRIDVKVRWTTVVGNDGQPSRIVETGTDQTEQKRYEAALRASEYRYYNLFQAMAASFWELDFSPVGAMLRSLREQGITDLRTYFSENPKFVREMMRATKIVDVNDQTVRLYAGGDKSGMDVPLDLFWPEDSTHIFAESVIAAVSKKPYYATETRLRKTNGEVFDALFTACFPPESVARGTLLIGVIDISERKKAFAELEKSEQRYRNLFNSMGVACYQIDTSALNALFGDLRASGVKNLSSYIDQNPEFLTKGMDASVVTDVNERAIHLLGGRDKGDVLGPVTRFWIPDDCIAFRQSLESGYAGNTAFEAETRQRTLDGRTIDVLFTVAAPFSMRETGTVLVSLTDISQRVRAQSRLQKIQADFAHAARISMLGELTASLAHEVNQPLAAIATNGAAGLRWLSRPKPDLDEVNSITKRMVADANRAASIISRIRSMATHRQPEMTPIDINGLIEEAVQFLRHEMQAQGVSIKVRLAPNLPPVAGDRTQLQQVMVNLALNAVQAMAQAESQRRQITVGAALKGTDHILISVEDTGPGIPEDSRPKLFESFFTTKSGGMGMGLPICRSIIESHEGEIWLDGAQNSGAKVVFTLPVAAHI